LIFFLVWHHVTFKLLPSWKFSNDDISGMGGPIDFVFDSMVGFWGTEDWLDLFHVHCRRPPSWKFQMRISLERVVRSTSCLVLG